MNRTFALLTLLALAVVATPAQAIDIQDICHLPKGCVPPTHGCQILTVSLIPLAHDIDENCLTVWPPPGGPDSADSESAAESGCVVLTASTSGESDVNESCAIAWLEVTQAAVIGAAEELVEEAPV